jgi:hypothetical protein
LPDGLSLDNCDLPGDEGTHYTRVEVMLLDLNSSMQGCHIVVRKDGDGPLRDDRAMVYLLIDEMDRYACDLDTVIECLRHGVGAGERR